MQVLLNTDPHTDGRQSMAEYLEATVKEALGHHGERITRVEAHLFDARSPAKANTDEIHCTLEARVVGFEPVVVTARAGTGLSRSASRTSLRRSERGVLQRPRLERSTVILTRLRSQR